MAVTVASRTLSVFIRRPLADVYAFVSNPVNLSQWASGLGQSVVRSGSGWAVQTAAGLMKMVFAEKNDLGVVDHYVYPPGGGEVYVPMRVLAHGDGSEVILTLFRLPAMSDEDYDNDAAVVQRDLDRLRQLLEQS